VHKRFRKSTTPPAGTNPTKQGSQLSTPLRSMIAMRQIRRSTKPATKYHQSTHHRQCDTVVGPFTTPGPMNHPKFSQNLLNRTPKSQDECKPSPFWQCLTPRGVKPCQPLLLYTTPMEFHIQTGLPSRTPLTGCSKRHQPSSLIGFDRTMSPRPETFPQKAHQAHQEL